MKISDILRHKGTMVVTIAPEGTVTELLASLAEHRIGALVVEDNGQVVGIVSERDVVRQLAARGPQILAGPVSDIMTTSVVSVAPNEDLIAVASTMTDRRIRHMPVIENGELRGIVTIGDVVSSRIRQLEVDRIHLEHYITG